MSFIVIRWHQSQHNLPLCPGLSSSYAIPLRKQNIPAGNWFNYPKGKYRILIFYAANEILLVMIRILQTLQVDQKWEIA